MVVDDSRAQRRLISTYLKRWGYHSLEAENGRAALALCQSDRPGIILSDWVMPGMNGLELCQDFRSQFADQFSYFILLTSKSEKDDIAQGLQIGADDFLTKPVNPVELHARLNAGMRLVKMERELKEKNRVVSQTLAEARLLQDALDRDLIEAKKLQQSLVPEREKKLPGADISLLLHPAGHVGGDLVGFFRAGEKELGIYALDVSGHGIASALLTARIAGFFSGDTPSRNIALCQGPTGQCFINEPSQVISKLNELMLHEMETDLYLTLLFGRCNLETGNMTISQAGQPHPVIQRKSGVVEINGEGGLPVGLIPGADYSQFDIKLEPGDRVLFASDGLTECENRSGEMLETEGLARILQSIHGTAGRQCLESIMWNLSNFSDDAELSDDVSAVLLEFTGSGQ